MAVEVSEMAGLVLARTALRAAISGSRCHLVFDSFLDLISVSVFIPQQFTTATTSSFDASSSAKISAGQANMGSDGDHKSIPSQHGRKRDKFLGLFRSTKTRETAKIQASKAETDIRHASTERGVHVDYPDSPLENVSSLETGTQSTTRTRKARSNIFSENVSRSAASAKVPKLGTRISNTPQLALCSSLLPKKQASSSHDKDPNGVQDQAKGASQDIPTDRTHLDWIKAIKKDTVEQDHIRWLGARMVVEFSKDAVKDSAAITEIILLGPFLDCEHYRKLLNCFIAEFVGAVMLDVHLLQGLIQLVQCASEGYLVADDLVKILSILRAHLQGTHQQSTENPYHLTLAVSRLLDVMAEHKVQDVKRVEEHEPLSEILSGLRSSADPFLMYQASYAYQALQYVPNNETPLQAVLRHSAGVADSLVKISGVLKMDLGSVLDGLAGFQAALSSTCDTAKTGYECFRSLMESGRGVFDSLKEGLVTGHKRPWYPALRAADCFARQGQLADMNRLIVEAPCRRDPLFQWGICQLLGEIAAGESWEIITRQHATDLLVDLYRNDMDWAQDESVKDWMRTLVMELAKTADLVIEDRDSDQKNEGSSTIVRPYPLQARLPMPRSSPLLTRVQEIPYVEYNLHQLKRQRMEEDKQPVFIPPMAKSSLQAPDSDVFPLMEKVTEFLASDRQVMLILGDSGAGKSTFNRHLECELWRGYKSGGQIPLFINMPALGKPESELIAAQLRMHNLSEGQIQELKLYRQFIVICDGYDESQLTTNLHNTNQLNRPGQWNVKLVVSCRSQYLGHDYRNRFVPQESDHYSKPALHLFQEAVITPFSRSQIEDYVERYTPLEPRPWGTEDYMEKLTTIPNLMDLVTNPFLLILSLGALPTVVQGRKDLTTVRITRVALYDSFIEHWIDANKRRLEKQKLKQENQTVLEELVEDGFERNGIEYQKRLAAAIFQEQEGRPVVEYTQKRDKSSWKAEFFGPEAEPALLRDCSLLNRAGNQP
ncbi:hypothetical protein BGZ67_004761 [Mortierella alpina]|nr:hypothetical protein BGZ67_004761 [Mortierella alpina]